MNPTKKPAITAKPSEVKPPAKVEETIEVKLVCDNYEDSDKKGTCKNCGEPLTEHKATAVKPPEANPVESAVATTEKPAEVLDPAEIDPHSGQIIFTDKHLALIKSQIAPTATPAEYDLFIMMARRTRLDPLLKQLYFIKYGSGAPSYVTSIDSYRIIAHRTNAFAGVDLPIYDYDNSGRLTHAAITVYKIVQGQKFGFSAKVKFSEYTTGKNQWATKPETMIAKVAEAHALRKAFPQDLNGVYTQDEMDQADNRPTPVHATTAPQRPVQSAPAARIAEAKPERLMTPGQLVMIKAIMQRKGATTEQLRDYLKRSFNLDTMKGLTYQIAEKTIDALTKLKDPERPAPAPVESAADFSDEDVAVFMPPALPPTEQTSFMGEAEVRLEDIPDDLGVGVK